MSYQSQVGEKRVERANDGPVLRVLAPRKGVDILVDHDRLAAIRQCQKELGRRHLLAVKLTDDGPAAELAGFVPLIAAPPPQARAVHSPANAAGDDPHQQIQGVSRETDLTLVSVPDVRDGLGRPVTACARGRSSRRRQHVWPSVLTLPATSG